MIMQITRLPQAQFSDAYGILCSSLPNQGDRDGLYPTFCRIPTGGKTIAHAHFESELFYIVNGVGLMKLQDKSETVGAGDLIRIPSFAKHELNNIGTQEMIFLSVYSEDIE